MTLDQFIEHWLLAKRAKLGVGYIREAIAEAEDIELCTLYIALQANAFDQVGEELLKICDRYWEPLARDAAAEIFDENGREVA